AGRAAPGPARPHPRRRRRAAHGQRAPAHAVARARRRGRRPGAGRARAPRRRRALRRDPVRPDDAAYDRDGSARRAGPRGAAAGGGDDLHDRRRVHADGAGVSGLDAESADREAVRPGAAVGDDPGPAQITNGMRETGNRQPETGLAVQNYPLPVACPLYRSPVACSAFSYFHSPMYLRYSSIPSSLMIFSTAAWSTCGANGAVESASASAVTATTAAPAARLCSSTLSTVSLGRWWTRP